MSVNKPEAYQQQTIDDLMAVTAGQLTAQVFVSPPDLEAYVFYSNDEGLEVGDIIGAQTLLSVRHGREFKFTGSLNETTALLTAKSMRAHNCWLAAQPGQF